MNSPAILPLLFLLSINGAQTVEDAQGNIVGLDLTSTWVTDADLAKVAQLRQLKTLDLSHTKITDAGLEHLKPLENVVALTCYYAESLTEDGIAHLKGWKNLEHLNLRGTKVTSKVFEHVAQLASLRSLDLGFTRIDDEGFEHLANLPHLAKLTIGGNRLSGTSLSLLRSLPSLTDLDVGGIQRVDSGLWGLPLTDQNLGRIGQLRQIRSLSLAAATLADRGIDRPGNPEAERSELRDLSPLASLVDLERLDLSRQPVTADVLKGLAALPKLRELRLGLATKLDDSVVPLLLSLKPLQTLYLSHTNPSSESIERLKALLAGSITASVDRRIAEWTLLMGGRVRLVGQPGYISDMAELLPGEFELESLDWVGMNVDPPDLERLTSLRHLRELHLPGPLWNRNADGGRDGSRDLHFLAPIETLEVLTFSDHFLDRIRFKDDGLSGISKLANLRELVLRQSDITGQALAPFRRLEALDATLCPVNDAGLPSLELMKELRRLRLGDTLVTDAGLNSLRNLSNLEELDLHGTAVTDTGLTHLSNLTRLRKLNLMGTAVSDAGISVLAGFSQLEEVNLYHTRISNAGLEALRGLRQLAEIDLRYSRVTGGGIDLLKANLPSARILYIEQSSRPQLTSQFFRPSPDGALNLAGTAVTDAQLEKLHVFPELRTLSLEATEVGDGGLRHVAQLTALQELDLSNTAITDAGLAHLANLRLLRRLSLANTFVEGSGLAHLKSLLALEELDLHGSPVGNTALAHLGQLPALRRLSLAATEVSDGAPLGLLTQIESLDLGSTDVTDAGLEPLKALLQLRTLILRDSRLTDKALAYLAGLSHLRALDLVRTRISDQGLVHLSWLTDLRSLSLDYGEITDAGLRHLAQLKRLTDLSLDSTHITDESIASLELFPNLKTVNLYHTLITSQGHTRLKTTLPGAKIIWDPESSLPNRRRS
jgi:Leucine-rich repeat (LRR) protein